MEPLRISNTMLRDWEDLCPIQFEARWISKTMEWKETQPMRWGTYFETLAIGSGVGGKTVKLSPTEEKSVLNDRIKLQAKKCKQWLKDRGGKVIAFQRYQNAEVVDSAGQTIPIMGGMDIEYMFNEPEEGPREGIIDLKFTGDNDSTFGKFAWGRPETMDYSQAYHYMMIKKHQTGILPKFEYWVFDGKPDGKAMMLEIEVDEYTILEHIERVSRAYNEIIMAIDFVGFQPRNTYQNCSTCPIALDCKHRRTMPEVVKIYK